MTRTTKTIFCCDYCKQEQESGHGLPEGWYAVTLAMPEGKLVHLHYCCPPHLLGGETDPCSGAVEGIDYDSA